MADSWALDLAKDLEWLDAKSSRIQWPSDRYEESIDDFCVDVEEGRIGGLSAGGSSVRCATETSMCPTASRLLAH